MRIHWSVLAIALIVLSVRVSGSRAEAPNGLSGTFGESREASTVVGSTGAMTYAVAFQLPPNRGSAQPALGLHYESGSQTGEAGLGWSLNLPSIERTALSGFPRYLDDGVPTHEDRFAYNGRPLTFICVVGGTPACPVDEHVGAMPNWAQGMRHYRLQVEDSFERFFWSPLQSRWIVQQRGGNTLELGLALTRPDLQLAPAQDTDAPSGKTHRWYLAVQRDSHDDRNMVVYRWASDGHGARSYLREIYYAPPPDKAAVAPSSAFAFHVDLRWEVPPYRQKDSTFADRRPHTRRLTRVAVAAMPWSGGTDRELVRAYDLAYYPERGEPTVAGEAPLWGRSSLKSVQMEGRCTVPVRESTGTLPFPTGCPFLPAVTFEYAAATLAFGAAIYVPLGTPGSTDILAYPTSTAVIDINRDGLPDVVQAWPSNHRRKSYKNVYNECKDGDFIIDAGADPQQLDPQLACNPDDPTDSTFDIRSARIHKAWVNGGFSAGGLRMTPTCLDAGGSEPRSPTFYQITGPQGFGSREPSLFTQHGAEAVSEWGNGALLWSLAGYHAFGFAPARLRDPWAPPGPDDYDETTFRKFCPESAIDPTRHALRWVKTGDASWSKDAQNRDLPEYRHFNIVDIDGDGYGDLLTETTTPAVDGAFERAAIRFTRKISGLESIDAKPGPALLPFVTSGGDAVTITPTFAEYSTYADINGDGILDLVTASATNQGGAPEVRLGDGRGGFGCDPTTDAACRIVGNGPGANSWLGRAFLLFTPERASPSPFDPKPWPAVADFGYTVAPATFFHDVTGDGLADIVRYEPSSDPAKPGRLRLWVNADGRTFRCANATDCVVATIGGGGVGSPAPYLTHHILFTDIDGNGTQDFVLIAYSGMWTFSFLVNEKVPPVGPRSPKPGLLTRIRNGAGSDIEVVYETIQELDSGARSTDPRSFQRPWTRHVPEVAPIVTRLATRDTQSVKGTPLAQPYAISRTRRFEYRDPAYDSWLRAFKGFAQMRSIAASGEVTQTWFYFGPCESGPSVDTNCLKGSDGGNDGTGRSLYPDKALVGVPVRVDTFVPGGGDRPAQWLSTRTWSYGTDAAWIKPAGARPDRPVILSQVARTDSYLYDTAATVSVVDQIGHPADVQKVPAQAARVHVRADTGLDSAGNLAIETHYGQVSSMNTAMAPDDVIQTRYLPTQGRCAADWLCRVRQVQTSDQPPGELADRALRDTRFQYNAAGDLIVVEGLLFATSSLQAGLDRDPVRGVSALPSAQTLAGWRLLRSFDVDDVGNVLVARGAPGPSQPCISTRFDAVFRQFPEIVSRFTGGGCSGTRLSERLTHDRGLGRALETEGPDRTLHRVETDAFGRPTKVFEPAADGTPSDTQLSVEIIHHIQEPTSWVEVRRRSDTDQFISAISVLNGIGEPVLGFAQADPSVDGSSWIVSDWVERDNDGRVAAKFRPWFFSGNARTVADTAAILSPPSSRASTFRDPFGRSKLIFDGTTVVAEFTYLPLKVTARDAEQRKAAGPFAGLAEVAQQDGHGRTVLTMTPAADGILSTSVEYLGTGEIATLRRSSDRDSFVYRRDLHWDSFGRLIVNIEPNTSGRDAGGALRAWRYVYDDEGRMVGTSDARRCGKNLYYDALGRLVAEDYSPCADGQAAYTAPDLATGDGTEAFYRYDAYPTGSTVAGSTFKNPPEAALGRLVSVQDLGAQTRLSYDERGRVRRTLRQIVKPGSPSASLDDRFADKWFAQEAEFDVGDRLRRRTLGLEGPPFPADSFESFTYSARGTLHQIGGAFGNLVLGLRYAPNGAPLDASLGDRAKTRTQMSYDSRDRLRHWRTARAAKPALWSAASVPSYSMPGADTTQLLLVDLEFGYDDVGNILSINDGSVDTWPAGSRPVSKAFKYDAAYRLTRVDYTHGGDTQVPALLREAKAADRHPVAERPGKGRIASQSFATDWQGNLVFSDDNEALRFDRSLGKIFNGKGNDGRQQGPNQMLDADGVRATYDPAGNMVELVVNRAACWTAMPECSHRFQYDWDEAGQLARARRWDFAPGVAAPAPATAPSCDVSYAYSEGTRTRKSMACGTASPVHTLDVFDTLKVEKASFAPATGHYDLKPEHQVGFAGGIARVFADRAQALPNAGTSPVHVFFNVGDYLGSSAFVIDKDSGEIVERTSYLPYGATESDFRPTRWGGQREDAKFTGQEQDLEVGATYFGARYYSPYLGRFMSADPLTIQALQSDLNPYAYVGGRVTSDVDPLGLEIWKTVPCGGGEQACYELIEDPVPRRENGASDRADAQAAQGGRRMQSFVRERSATDRLSLADATPVFPFFLPVPGPYLRPYQPAPQGAPPGMDALRQLNGQTGLGVANFSREHYPGTDVRNLTLQVVGVMTAAGTEMTIVGTVAARTAAAVRYPARFASEAKWAEHFEKHGAEFAAKDMEEYLQVGRDIMKYGYRVEYVYNNTNRTGYVMFMQNSRKGLAKFGFVGLSADGEFITTIHIESGNSFWRMMGGAAEKTITPR
jgi:RHS repeat-associated protein